MNVINDDQFRNIFSRRLRELMDIRKISQAELARRSGVSQTCISRYLNGSRMPSGYCMTQLAGALRCEVRDLTSD